MIAGRRIDSVEVRVDGVGAYSLVPGPSTKILR